MSSEPSERAPTTLAHKKRVKRKDKAPYANNKMDEKYDNQLPEQQGQNFTLHFFPFPLTSE